MHNPYFQREIEIITASLKTISNKKLLISLISHKEENCYTVVSLNLKLMWDISQKASQQYSSCFSLIVVLGWIKTVSPWACLAHAAFYVSYWCSELQDTFLAMLLFLKLFYTLRLRNILLPTFNSLRNLVVCKVMSTYRNLP